MLKLTDLVVANESVGSIFIAVAIVPVYEYISQKKTDKIIAQKVSIVLPQKQYEKIDVKVPIEGVQDELILNKEVIFEKLELYIYWYNNDYRIGARAQAVHNKIKKVAQNEQHALH